MLHKGRDNSLSLRTVTARSEGEQKNTLSLRGATKRRDGAARGSHSISPGSSLVGTASQTELRMGDLRGLRIRNAVVSPS
jgi:hypothetical protein